MRLFRFDKTLKLIFALLCAVGFSTTAFAGGNWGAGDSNEAGCGKNDSVHCAGPKFRCFKYYGHTKSYTLNSDENQTDKKWTTLFGKYCLPKVSIWCNNNTKKDGTMCKSGDTDPECNMKEWKWNLDFKDDTVAETERSKNNCKFLACEPNVIGEEKFWYGGSSNAHHIFYQVANPPNNNPIDVYFYCANAATDFYQVAKCVDKDNDTLANPDMCDNDTTGKRYYYKPNCDSETDCEKKMADWINNDKLKMCYNPWEQTKDSNIVVFEDNAGGQTVGFSQFKYKDNNSRVGPCRYTPYYRTQFDLIGDDSKETIGDLVIMDKDDDRVDSLVHTKVSGEGYYFKIKEVGGDKDADSTLKSVSCKITDKDGNEVVKESVAKSISGGIVARVMAFFSSKSGKRSEFQFPADAQYKPAASGSYTITCTPYDKDGKKGDEKSAEFFVAPYSYVYSNVSMVFDSKSGLIPKGDTSGKATVNLISNQKGIEVKHEPTGKATQKQSVQLAWDKKPVVKIGESLSINLLSVQAHTKDGSIDEGVDWDTNSIGKIVAKTPTAQTLAITNADNPQTAGVTTNAKCTLGQDNPNPIQNAQSGMTMNKGNSDKTATIGTISTLEAQVARATIDILDEELYAKILAEKEGTNAEGKKKCDVDGYDCPFPQALRLENVDYEIAPKDFKIEVVDKNDNPIKVLYFGQGTSPKVEAGTKVRVTALKIDGATASQKPTLDKNTDIATTFTYGCAAQNMQFATDSSVTGSSGSGTGTQTSGVYFEIIGRDGSGFTVKARDFTDGVAGSSDAIIKVQKDKDTPFTPAMKSEPVIIDSANSIIPMQMQYEKFPPEISYYPKYEPSLSQDGSLVVLRGRINSIDTDNGSGSGAGGSITPTKVWYEFQCEYCNLDAVAKITGWDKNGGYTNADRSPTQQGWWIDRTFGTNNGNYITTSKIEIESGGLSIGSVSPNNGVDTTSRNTIGSQSISYGSKKQGTHKLNIRHGNESTDSTFNGATTMPYFLLYNAYWTGYADVKRDSNNKEVLDSSGNTIPTSTLVSPKRWNTSSFVYVKEATKDDPRNYGVDTGGAKNTRSGGRTGKF